MAQVKVSGMPRFVDLGSDVNWEDHGGVWGRPTADGTVWYVVRFDRTWYDPARPNDCECDVIRVDLADLKADPARLKSVLDTIGAPNEDEPEPSDRTIVEAAVAYGAYEREWQEFRDNRPTWLRAEARRFVERRLS